MKKFILIISILLTLTACNNTNTTNIEKSNTTNTWIVEENVDTSNDVNLFSKTTKITFPEENVVQFKKDLEKLDNEIKNNTWSITYRQILDKARLLDYLWKTWEGLKLYVDNYNIDNNDKSLAYNHNLAKFYEKLSAYDSALKIYWKLIKDFWKNEYMRDVANLWKNRWDNEKYEKAMELYRKKFSKNNPSWLEIKDVKVWSGWTIKLK